MKLFRATAIEKRVLWKISKDQASIAIERMTREWIPKGFNTYGKGC